MKDKSASLSKKIGQLLRKRKMTVAVAESCTGGLLSSVITDVPGSSDYFLGGVVAYSNAQKEKLLRIPRLTLKKCSAVSAQVAVLMAKKARRISRSDIAVGITGYAGPTGGTEKDPRGTVYICIVTASRTAVKKRRFKGSRVQVKRRAVECTLTLLNRMLSTARNA